MIAQLAIMVFGASAVWLSQDKRESMRRWACICGLLGQPFWFWTAYQAEQWGVFIVCFLYAASWVRGFITHWMPAQTKREPDEHRGAAI